MSVMGAHGWTEEQAEVLDAEAHLAGLERRGVLDEAERWFEALDRGEMLAPAVPVDEAVADIRRRLGA